MMSTHADQRSTLKGHLAQAAEQKLGDRRQRCSAQKEWKCFFLEQEQADAAARWRADKLTHLGLT